MTRKGFTIIELLAVIVVLAVIALIAIPVITSVIDKAKQGALKDSAYGILDAGEMYLAKNMGEGITDTMEFVCSNGVCINVEEKINYKGQIETGRIRIYSDSKIELCITDNKYSALKKVTEKGVKVEKGTCKYEELNYDVSALVSKDDYDKLSKELNNLKALLNQTDITADDVKEGKTALTKDGLITGVYSSDNFTYTGSGTLALHIYEGSDWGDASFPINISIKNNQLTYSVSGSHGRKTYGASVQGSGVLNLK